MGTSRANLVGIGTPPEMANQLGDSITTTLAGAGTSQTGATLLTGTVNAVTTTGGNTAFVTPTHTAGRTMEVYNTSSTTALVFCPSGSTMNGSSNGSVSVAQNKGVYIRFITPTQLVSVTGA